MAQIETDQSLLGYELSYGLIEGFDYYPGYGEAYEQLNLPAAIGQHTINTLLPYGGYLIEVRALTTDTSTGSGVSFEFNPNHVSQYGSTTVGFTSSEGKYRGLTDSVVLLIRLFFSFI